MGEHTFDGPERPSSREAGVVCAIGLAEHVLEEATSGDQDWRVVAAIAGELARQARRLAGDEKSTGESARACRRTLSERPGEM